jgi:hypothetical protein
MHKFLDTYNYPKQNQKDINHLNRTVTLNKIEAVVSQKREVQDLTDSLLNSIRPLKKNWYKCSLNFSLIEREGILPNSFYEASIPLIPKPDKDTSEKENYKPISIKNINARISIK